MNMGNLLLKRKVGETVVIGDDVTVTVESIRGSRVGLRIAAPTTVRVDRVEVRERRNHEEESNRA